ncbi:Predicted ATPase [Buttiauxella agrestis]|uniref:Predicted ATPase n=1 Tax=Buttiauxella agrestis TaxID=82977 RepID=A0A381CC27_9ENTR|nr:AAA family ATPase [Buttiauxella agrestis]SUW65458.1 Predicted ATPase [Buttiauxella agrestis]
MTQAAKVYISEILFSSGQKISFEEDEKIIIVGPNNSGKSQTLREIIEISSSATVKTGQVIKKISMHKQGSIQDLENLLKKGGAFINNNYIYGGQSIYYGWLSSWEDKDRLTNICPIFIKNVTANDRLSICNQQNSIAPDAPKSRPQHYLYENSTLMSHISMLFKKAFNKDIMFNYRGGSVLPIHVGKLPTIDGLVDRVSDEYVNLVRQNPLLDMQGDGVKSYAGILFECVVQKLDVTMIDEPEAFLHPPQMRMLGDTLSSEVEKQLFVATHSSDILRGFLEGTKGNVKILRIQREDDTNVVHIIDKKSVEQLWSKPVLRYSNALDSLFHEQVIICEDDSDCRLFNFVADYLEKNSDNVYPDTCYIPTGGKHAVAGIVEALRPSGVPVKAIFDFDLISERNTLTRTLNAFGSEGVQKDEIIKLWERINSAVTQSHKPLTPDEFKTQLLDCISEMPADKISKGKVEELFKQRKPWHDVKVNGFNGLPKGEIRKTYKELEEKLKFLGIFLIPVGEIENFSAETGLHGPSFVEKFLSSRDVEDSELAPLRDFVHCVYSTKISSFKPTGISDETHSNGDKVATEMADAG